MKIGGAGSATCRGCALSHLVHLQSSATSAGCATFSEGEVKSKEGQKGKNYKVIALLALFAFLILYFSLTFSNET